MNTPVSFEIIKLLEEKGIKLDSHREFFYEKSDTNNKFVIAEIIHEQDFSDDKKRRAPTIAEVVMWLYKKHGIWVSVEATDDFTMFCFRVRKKEISRLSFNYNSPTEAYEAAIIYTLENLLP